MGFRKFRPVRYPMCGMSVSSQPGDKKKGRGPRWLGSKGEMLYIHSGAVNQRDPAVRGQQPVSLKEGTVIRVLKKYPPFLAKPYR